MENNNFRKKGLSIMNHKVVRVDNLMYKGCEPHWKCIHCNDYFPFHCYSKPEIESEECSANTKEGQEVDCFDAK